MPSIPQEQKPVVKIAPNNQVFDLPVIVGIEERLFAEAGLDVRFSATYADRERDSAAGPIMAALAGAAGGAAAGGFTGALIGLGIPEYEAKRYEGKITSGNILLSVHTEDGKERDRAKHIFQEGGAEDIAYTGETSVPKDQRSSDRQ